MLSGWRAEEGEVIPFRANPGRTRRPHGAGPDKAPDGGIVLLFTGVRYERLPDPFQPALGPELDGEEPGPLRAD
jgi:hypothetical protein